MALLLVWVPPAAAAASVRHVDVSGSVAGAGAVAGPEAGAVETTDDRDDERSRRVPSWRRTVHAEGEPAEPAALWVVERIHVRLCRFLC